MASHEMGSMSENPYKSPLPEEELPAHWRQPNYAVVVMNDDLHSFQYVIETFKKIFNYSMPKCFLYASKIHFQGRAIVWSGTKAEAELKCEELRSAGPDLFNGRNIDFPLGVEVESLPR